MNDGQGLENRMGKQCKFGQSEDAVRSNSLRLRGDSDHEKVLARVIKKPR